MQVMIWLFVLLCSCSRLPSVWGDGQAATIVYSRDGSCVGKELVRSYTGQCTRYLNTETNLEEYVQFFCSKNNGFVSVQSFVDSKCTTRVGNLTEILSNYRGDGSCQQIFGYQNNYLSAQLFCETTDNSLRAAMGSGSGSNIVHDKITFRYYSNLDTTCAFYPSIIEMWSEDVCLYYESIGFLSHEAYVGTGMYGIYSQEVSESGWGHTGTTPSIVSVRYFNTNDCRQHTEGPIEGDPPPGGIGSPVRLRSRQRRVLQGKPRLL